jgi:hypothetical protein
MFSLWRYFYAIKTSIVFINREAFFKPFLAEPESI